MKRLGRCILLLGLAAVFAGSAGCGGADSQPAGTVSGTLLTADGKPVTNGTINFSLPEKGAAASTALDEAGEFRFEQPLPVGTYKVYVSAAYPENADAGHTPPALEAPNVPSKYLSESTSDLTAEVTEGENVLPLKLNP